MQTVFPLGFASTLKSLRSALTKKEKMSSRHERASFSDSPGRGEHFQQNFKSGSKWMDGELVMKTN